MVPCYVIILLDVDNVDTVNTFKWGSRYVINLLMRPPYGGHRIISPWAVCTCGWWFMLLGWQYFYHLGGQYLYHLIKSISKTSSIESQRLRWYSDGLLLPLMWSSLTGLQNWIRSSKSIFCLLLLIRCLHWGQVCNTNFMSGVSRFFKFFSLGTHLHQKFKVNFMLLLEKGEGVCNTTLIAAPSLFQGTQMCHPANLGDRIFLAPF